MKNLFDVSGKVALITGGRRGIGREFALALNDAGAKVAVTAKSEDSMGLPSEIFYFRADLTKRDERSNIIRRVVDHYGGIDILVNNAAIINYTNALNYTQTIWDELLAINLTAVFELSIDAAKFMKNGKIIQLASVASFNGARNIVGYATAKHGLLGMIKCLSNELMPLGINVNGIAPGVMETEMHAQLMNNDARRKEVESRIPAGRLGKPIDLIGVLLFLASDASKYVSGTTIVVDGGYCGR